MASKKIEDKLESYLPRCAYDDKVSVKRLVLDAFQHDSYVELSMESYYDEDGLEYPELLQIKAVASVNSSTGLSQIPLEIYITYNFPIQPPVVFVRPSRDMVLKTYHPDISSTGLVRIPYFEEWSQNHEGKSIADLIVQINHAFYSHGPPVVKRRVVAANVVQVVSTQSNSNSNSYSNSCIVGTDSRPSAYLVQYPDSDYGQQQQQQPQQQLVKPLFTSDGPALVSLPTSASAVRSNAYDKVQVYSSPIGVHSYATSEKRQRTIQILNARMKKDFKKKLWELADSANNEIRIGDGLEKKLAQMEGEKKSITLQTQKLKELIQTVSMQQSAVDAWSLQENEKKMVSTEADPEAKFCPSDPLSLQLLTLDAEIKALDDVIMTLSHPSSSNNNINLPKLLAVVRELSSKRFIKEAFVKKIYNQIVVAKQVGAAPNPNPSSFNPNINSYNMASAPPNTQQQFQYSTNVYSTQQSNSILLSPPPPPPPPPYSFPSVPVSNHIQSQPPSYTFPSTPVSSNLTEASTTSSANQNILFQS